ncbi:MAG: SDR family oxidoreductase [Saprospiraceae bacterium]
MSQKIFITGGTGFIGGLLCNRLADQGYEVTALVRSPQKATRLQHPNITLVQGDLDDTLLMEQAMKGASAVFHIAALAGVWASENLFEQVNVIGTKNVLDAAQKAGVAKIIATSTAGVMGPATHGPVHEETPRSIDFFSDYERTKHQAEILMQQYAQAGQHIVIVNPTRVYGPGPLNVSNAATKLIDQYRKGQWRFLPGDGHSVGNYVFVEDVVNGHLLAWKHGRSGERYLLGGEDATYREFFDNIAVLNGKGYRLFPLPLAIMLGFSYLQLWLATYAGREPLITPGWVRKYNYHWSVSNEKARRELGYVATPLKIGIQKTLDWLKRNEEK